MVARAVAASVALAALTLLALDQNAYDPTAWLIWGRELSEGTLDMTGGPSWKPLPVAFTTLFAFAGDDVAPLLWLVVARASGFLAVVMAFVVARRLGGRTAGLIAAAGLLLATDFLFNVLRGDSEGMLVALSLLAVELHLRGRTRAALIAGLAAGLLRPEVWLVLAGHVVLTRRHLVTATLGAAVLLAAWFVPDYLAEGEWLRGAERAQNPVEGSPGASAFPFGMTFVYASIMLTWPLYAGAAWLAWRDRRTVVRAMFAAATVMMVAVAVLAELGFTGNIRYVTLPASLVCVLGAVGLMRLPRPRLGTALAGVGVAVSLGIVVHGGVRLVREELTLGARLDAAVEAAGGEDAIRSCGQVATTAFERQALAYRLELPSVAVATTAERPGIALVREGRDAPGADALPVIARVEDWTVRRYCPAR